MTVGGSHPIPTGPAASRKQRKARRHQEILTIAAGLIAERGFASVRLEDLGAEVGMSGPAIYRYFPSKDALLAELLIGISQSLLKQASSRRAELSSPATLLRLLIDDHIRFALLEPDLIRLHDRDLRSLSSDAMRTVRCHQRAYMDIWVRTLRQIHPTLASDQTSTLTHAIFGLLNCTPHLSSSTRRHVRAETIRDAALRVAMLGDDDASSDARAGSLSSAD